MNRKKRIRLASMAVCVILLGAAYLAEDYILDRRQEKLTVEKEQAQEQLVRLSIDAEDIRELSFKGDDGDIIFNYDGEKWTAPEDEHFVMDPSAIGRLVKDLGSLTATRVLEDKETGEEASDEGSEKGSGQVKYGLEPARQTVTIKTEDGSEIKLYIGDRSDSSHELYAATSLEGGRVFLTKTALDEHFSGTLKSFALYEEVPAAPAEKIRSIKVEKETDSFTLNTPGDDTCSVTDEDGKTESADLSAAGTVLYLLEDLSWLHTLEYYANDPETLKQYGLDDPACAITVSLEGNGGEGDGAEEDGAEEFTILTGGSDENGNYYVKLKGSDQVHSIRREYLASFVEGKAQSFWSLAFSFVSMSDLDRLDVIRENEEWTLRYVNSGSSQAEESESKEENELTEETAETAGTEKTEKWLVNGKEVTKENFIGFFYACVSVTDQERLKEVREYDQEPELILRYYLTDGSIKELKYYPADQNFYTVIYDGGSKAASVNRIYVKGMLDALDELVSR